jgi:hypothetical protein
VCANEFAGQSALTPGLNPLTDSRDLRGPKRAALPRWCLRLWRFAQCLLRSVFPQIPHAMPNTKQTFLARPPDNLALDEYFSR